MSLISLIIILAVVGLIVWAVTTYIPMDAGIKKLILIVAIVACVLYVLQAFGVLGSMDTVRIGHVG